MDVFSALGKRRRRKGVHIFTMVLAVDFSILTMPDINFSLTMFPYLYLTFVSSPKNYRTFREKKLQFHNYSFYRSMFSVLNDDIGRK